MTGAASEPIALSDALRSAALIAVEALEERAQTLRWMLQDPSLTALADPQALHESLERDQDAALVLRGALEGPPA
jgi:uncharacterized protein YbaP (TraB family)